MAPPLHTLNLNLLVALDALLAEQSVTRAAHRIGVTQSAMSRSLARLREMLDDPLLVRVGRGMVRTPRAEALAMPLRGALAHLQQTLDRAPTFDPATAQRQFSIMTADLLSTTLLPGLDAHVANAPGVRLRVTALRSQQAGDQLLSGEIDALVAHPLERPGLTSQTLFSDDYVVALAADHPAASVDWTLEAWLALDHLVVSPVGLPGGRVDTALAEQGRSRRVVMTVPYFLAAPWVLASSRMALTAPRCLLAPMTQHLKLVLRPVPIALPPFVVALTWPERMTADPGHRWLRDAVVAAA